MKDYEEVFETGYFGMNLGVGAAGIMLGMRRNFRGVRGKEWNFDSRLMVLELGILDMKDEKLNEQVNSRKPSR